MRPESEVDLPEGARFWNMPSDEFFSAYDGSPPHVIFIDGDHSYEQAKRDFENALRLLRPAGIVFMHDTWPRDESDATEEFCGGVWKLAEELSESASWSRSHGRRSRADRRAPARRGAGPRPPARARVGSASMAEFPAPEHGILLTHFIVSDDVERSRRFYTEVLGGETVLEGEPSMVALANGWVIINAGGGRPRTSRRSRSSR